MIAATNLPWIIAVMSTVSNFVVEVMVEGTLEYGVKYLRGWYGGEAGVQDANCIQQDMPATLEQAYGLLVYMDQAFFDCVEAYYSAQGVMPL